MEVQLDNLSHKFKGNNLFSGLSHTFLPGSKTAIIGQNGSGKSTLLKIISGFLTPSSGSVFLSSSNTKIELDQAPSVISVCTPFLTLEDQFTLKETFDFHYKFKKIRNGLSHEDFFKICFLENDLEKKVGDLSSGMTQRLKLALAMLTEAKLILLDEPCSNLDQKGKEFYTQLINSYTSEATVIVASNSVKEEIEFCSATLNLS